MSSRQVGCPPLFPTNCFSFLFSFFLKKEILFFLLWPACIIELHSIQYLSPRQQHRHPPTKLIIIIIFFFQRSSVNKFTRARICGLVQRPGGPECDHDSWEPLYLVDADCWLSRGGLGLWTLTIISNWAKIPTVCMSATKDFAIPYWTWKLARSASSDRLRTEFGFWRELLASGLDRAIQSFD